MKHYTQSVILSAAKNGRKCAFVGMKTRPHHGKGQTDFISALLV
jgi:hypothetical protein